MANGVDAHIQGNVDPTGQTSSAKPAAQITGRVTPPSGPDLNAEPVKRYRHFTSYYDKKTGSTVVVKLCNAQGDTVGISPDDTTIWKHAENVAKKAYTSFSKRPDPRPNGPLKLSDKSTPTLRLNLLDNVGQFEVDGHHTGILDVSKNLAPACLAVLKSTARLTYNLQSRYEYRPPSTITKAINDFTSNDPMPPQSMATYIGYLAKERYKQPDERFKYFHIDVPPNGEFDLSKISCNKDIKKIYVTVRQNGQDLGIIIDRGEVKSIKMFHPKVDTDLTFHDLGNSICEALEQKFFHILPFKRLQRGHIETERTELPHDTNTGRAICAAFTGPDTTNEHMIQRLESHRGQFAPRVSLPPPSRPAPTCQRPKTLGSTLEETGTHLDTKQMTDAFEALKPHGCDAYVFPTPAIFNAQTQTNSIPKISDLPQSKVYLPVQTTLADGTQLCGGLIFDNTDPKTISYYDPSGGHIPQEVWRKLLKDTGDYEIKRLLPHETPHVAKNSPDYERFVLNFFLADAWHPEYTHLFGQERLTRAQVLRNFKRFDTNRKRTSKPDQAPTRKQKSTSTSRSTTPVRRREVKPSVELDSVGRMMVDTNQLASEAFESQMNFAHPDDQYTLSAPLEVKANTFDNLSSILSQINTAIDASPWDDSPIYAPVVITDGTGTGKHYVGLIVDRKNRQIHYYDSMGVTLATEGRNGVKNLCKVLAHKFFSDSTQYVDPYSGSSKIHQTEDDVNCGRYLLTAFDRFQKQETGAEPTAYDDYIKGEFSAEALRAEMRRMAEARVRS